MEEWKKAWAAGVVDFQGHIVGKNNARRARGSQQILLYVDTSIAEIIDRLGEMTGSNVEMASHHRVRPEWNRRGCAEHCPEEHIHVKEWAMPMTGRWTVTGAALVIVLWNLKPYLTTDREPWDWALTQCLKQLRLTGQGSAAVRNAARRLYGLGWEIPPPMRSLIPRELEAAKLWRIPLPGGQPNRRSARCWTRPGTSCPSTGTGCRWSGGSPMPCVMRDY